MTRHTVVSVIQSLKPYHIYSSIAQFLICFGIPLQLGAQQTRVNLPINSITILFGYIYSDNISNAINSIILIAKIYLFSCARHKTLPNRIALEHQLRKNFREQKLLAKLNNKYDKFNKKWKRFVNLFVDS